MFENTFGKCARRHLLGNISSACRLLGVRLLVTKCLLFIICVVFLVNKTGEVTEPFAIIFMHCDKARFVRTTFENDVIYFFLQKTLYYCHFDINRPRCHFDPV